MYKILHSIVQTKWYFIWFFVKKDYKKYYMTYRYIIRLMYNFYTNKYLETLNKKKMKNREYQFQPFFCKMW